MARPSTLANPLTGAAAMLRAFRRPTLLAVLLAMALAGCGEPGSPSSNPVDDGDSPAADIKGVDQPQPGRTDSR